MSEHYRVVQAFDGEAVLCSKTRRLFGPAKALAGEMNRLAYKAETAETICDYWQRVSGNLQHALLKMINEDNHGTLTLQKVREVCVKALKEVAE